ncbi:hypothetical protein KJ359_007445 [Pestalotiopsis sp. 9143b]|nr:hypothetical protein KJ359_007445 [Pestalotiopsis sp. 9143b]
MFVKLSLLLLYFRLFRPAPGIRIPIWLGIIVITAFYTACNVLTFVFCIPRSDDVGWGSIKYNERCGTQYLKVTTAQGVFSAATDFYVLFIPINTVMGLKLSLKKRAGVASVFMGGLLACGVSIAGAIYRFKDELALQPDYTWDGVYIQSFGVVELNIGVICCCVPVTAALYVEIHKSVKSAWRSLWSFDMKPEDTVAFEPRG